MTDAPVTRWFLDTEFNEDGRTIELISIALVSDDGREYYAASADFDPDACNDWVKANVLPLLPIERRFRLNIADDVRELLLADGKKPEVWAYFADYDWVALCQLFGPMITLPKGLPMFCMDLKQLMKAEGVSRDQLPKQAGTTHDALADARWVRDAHRAITELRAARAPVEAGVVTREHRKVAAALVRESDGNPSLAAWVSDGDVNEGNWWICDACVMDAAQAIADAEARGAARAAPPADEVPGLTEAERDVLSVARTYAANPTDMNGILLLKFAEELRENHLKGKR